MTHHRPERVAEAIKEEVTEILRDDIKDPRVGFVTVTRVEVTNDLRHAKILVSIMGNEEEKKATLEGLKKAQGFVRSALGQRIRLRFSPEVTFKFDPSIEEGAKILTLLESVKGAEHSEP